MRWLVAWLALLMVVGCGDDDEPCADGACAIPDGAVPDGGAAPAAPVIDWLEVGTPPIAPPLLTPCPEGWQEVTADGEPATCDPYGEPFVEGCAGVDEARFPGEASCRRVGPECPPGGGLPVDVPADRPVIYVLEGAAPGGDGMRATPYDSLAAFSFATLARDIVVAIGTGHYDAEVSPRAGVTLLGACVDGTVLTSSSVSDSAGVVTVAGDGVEVRALQIAEAERPGVFIAGAGRSVSLDSVVIAGARVAAVIARTGGTVDANEVVVRDTRGRAVDLEFGRGMSLDGGARARFTRAIFEGNHEIGVYAGGAGTTLDLSDSAIRATQPLATNLQFGRGIDVESGAAAELRRVLIAENHDVGVFALEAGASVLLEDVVVRDTESDALTQRSGRGVNLQRGVSLQANRLLLERNRDVGLFANEASQVTLADVIIRDVAAQERDGVLGRGVEAQLGATMDIARALIERTSTGAVHVSRAATVMRMEDVVVRDTECEPATGLFGRGINVQFGAEAELTRVLLERASETGVFANDPDSLMALSDVVVRDTRPNLAAGDFGRGVDVGGGAVARLARVLLDGNLDAALFSSAGGSVEFDDLVVRDTGSRELDGTGGHAIFVQLEGQVNGTRARLERNRDAAVVAFSDSQISLSDLYVSDTAERACAVDTCPDDAAGSGVVSVLESTVAIDRFALTGAALCGVQLARGGSMDLSHGEVSGSPIGACIQVEGYDTTCLTNEVLYLDNDSNLQATDLPVPDALSTLDPGT